MKTRANIVITIVIVLFMLLACLQVTGVLAAEPTTTPTRTMRPWVSTSTPAPFTATAYPGPATTDSPDCPRPTRTPTPTLPPSDVGVTEFTAHSGLSGVEWCIAIFALALLAGVVVGRRK